MGKQTGILLYSGKLGDQVGYYRKNKKGKKEWWTRRAPQNVRQTAATQRAATDFGTASKCSRLVRHALRPWLQYYGYHFDHNRLNKAFIDVIQADDIHKTGFKVPTFHHLQSLTGFSFNDDKATHQYLTGHPAIAENDNNTISISLPGIHISNTQTHKGITHVCIKAIALPFAFTQHDIKPVVSETITIKRGDIPQAITLTLPANKEQSIIVLEIQCAREINGRIEISANTQTAAMDIIAVLPAAKAPKPERISRNKLRRMDLIPPYCQPVKRSLRKQHHPLYPLKE
ncbi:hypothetical protein [Chitinophaga sp. S165]|uniref:hypothetical protein n=1 Tax=Chitinophaga sp. S165 TaxID=2135462 RepID=UPI000D714B57|nr:hypothetical protein [Chitinophaga sp. S165]PWV46917.1 hypothetical protein C7475_1094 [Chitinophaga sp. S165]